MIANTITTTLPNEEDRGHNAEHNVWIDVIGFKDMMLMISCLNEALDQLAVANNMSGYGYMLSRENGHVQKKELDIKDMLRRGNIHVLKKELDIKEKRGCMDLKKSNWRKS